MVVKRQAVDAVRRGHPWIYRDAVAAVTPRVAEPHLVRILTEQDEPLGAGVFDPASPIAVRVWAAGTEARLGGAVVAERLTAAFALRRTLFADGATTAYRLLNGEGDRTPGLVVDRYDDVAVLRIDGDGARMFADAFAAEIAAVLRSAGITTLLERSRQPVHVDATKAQLPRASKVAVRFGPVREKVVVREHDVPFMVDLAHGQKTGAFLDQRENRRRIFDIVGARARAGLGVRVLNLFSYTGGFSQRAALAGGSVTSVDVASKAHVTAQESFRLAGIDLAAHTFVTADAFAWLAEAKRNRRTWDVVICDPPSFAPNARAKAKAIAAYRSLHRACADVLAPRGHLVAASCSSHVTAEDFMTTLDDIALGRADLRLVDLFGPPADHPTLPAFPEGRYLKLAVLA